MSRQRQFLRAWCLWCAVLVLQLTSATAQSLETVIQQGHELAVFSLLDDDCALVVAYALHTLRLMRSAHLASLPPTLLERVDRFKKEIGSFRLASELGDYARRLRTLAFHDEF